MEKVSDYLLNLPVDDDTENETRLPELSTEEEKEIMKQLGLTDREDGSMTAAERIMATVRSVREFSLAVGNEVKDVNNNDIYVDYGTVIIKTKSGKAAMGTLRVKKGDDRFGSIVIKDDVSPDDLPSNYDTLRVIETCSTDSIPDFSKIGKTEQNQKDEVR